MLLLVQGCPRLQPPNSASPLPSAAAASHSLRYFHTALSEPVQGLPQFVQVGYVDDQPIDLNDSARQELPQVPRMELHADGPWPWDRRSRAPWSAEQVSLANLATLQKYYSQSGGECGLHTLQWMFGCELRSDGSKGGYMQFGYDGRDFLSLDKEHLRWTAADATAQLTKRKWEAEPAIAQGWKAYLEGECVEWLRRYLEYGKETLQRTEPPEVKVTHQKSSTENVETLVCQAHGFYPKEIEAAWTRDGENWEHGTFCNRVAPIPDGTYYISLYTDVEPEERGRYRCRVAHAGLSQPLALAWEGPAVSKLGLPLLGCMWTCVTLSVALTKKRWIVAPPCRRQPQKEQGKTRRKAVGRCPLRGNGLPVSTHIGEGTPRTAAAPQSPPATTEHLESGSLFSHLGSCLIVNL
uniref:Ig-like domain-containing protein n=1 Tax=Varanus komodoensis TaxID=61221 RepID=A0A8D2JI55_VARKO